MTFVFVETDRTGRKIHLSDERWSHMQKHAGISGAIEQIKETLKLPDAITELSYDPQVHFYYKYYKERKEYLFISVKYINGEGFVITGFYTDKIK